MTEDQPLSAAEIRGVQVIPSGLVMTRFPIPLLDTATKSPFPYATEFHELAAAAVLNVHVIPSGLVITRSYVPV